MITGIHHIQITIPLGAENQARGFYCGTLGLPEIEKPDSLKDRGGLWLQAGSLQVHVGAEGDVERDRTKAHVAYQVSDLRDWRNRITDAGIETLEGIPIPGFDRFEFRDPFGNRVEMIEPLEPSS